MSDSGRKRGGYLTWHKNRFAGFPLLPMAMAWLVLTEGRVQAVGSDEIPFRKQTVDLGLSESCAVADVNKDGRLDIISGENWYEQVAHSPGSDRPWWIKHKFRNIGYTSFYLENLIDIAVDVNGDGFPDIVSCSYWSKPLTWWRNPARQKNSGKTRRSPRILPWSLSFCWTFLT